MNAEGLKAIQTPLKEKYKQDPQSAVITLRAEGRASGLTCQVETGKALVEAGLHPATGGRMLFRVPNPEPRAPNPDPR